MVTLPSKLVVTLGPDLGVCIALHSSVYPNHAFGILYRVKPGEALDYYQEPDLKAVVLADAGMVSVEALTPDGEAFLALASERV
jgi:hypothetical protein